MLNKILIAISTYKTYQVGLLQAKAYRLLKQRTNRILTVFDISTLDWALLGLLAENPGGLRLSAIAEELGVEAPLVTRMIQKLQKKAYVEFKEDPTDSRAKIVGLTRNGAEFVKKTEAHVRKNMKSMLNEIPPADLLAYIAVLRKIIENEAPQ